MTRKDFQLIADVIKASNSKLASPLHAAASSALHEELAYAFAAALTKANPRFNQALFLKACGAK
jgi:hypothetical protein